MESAFEIKMQSLRERVNVVGAPTPPGLGTNRSAFRRSEDNEAIRAIDHEVFALSESLSIRTMSPTLGVGLDDAHFFGLAFILIMELDKVVINEDMMSSALWTYWEGVADGMVD